MSYVAIMLTEMRALAPMYLVVLSLAALGEGVTLDWFKIDTAPYTPFSKSLVVRVMLFVV